MEWATPYTAALLGGWARPCRGRTSSLADWHVHRVACMPGLYNYAWGAKREASPVDMAQWMKRREGLGDCQNRLVSSPDPRAGGSGDETKTVLDPDYARCTWRHALGSALAYDVKSQPSFLLLSKLKTFSSIELAFERYPEHWRKNQGGLGGGGQSPSDF